MKSAVTVPRQNNLTRSGGGVTFRVFLFSLILFSAFFFSANTTFAATYYWVGNANGLTSAKANWHTSAKACDGAGNASAAPVAADTINYVSNCTASSTIDSALSVTSISIAAGYTGTITQNANVTLTANFTSAGGTWTVTSGTITLSGAVSSTINTGSLLASSTLVINKGSGTFAVVIATSTVVNLGNSPTSVLSTNYQGDLTNNGTILLGTGVWNISNWNGYFTNNGTISGSSSGWIFGNIYFINNAGATATLTSGTWTINGGYINNSGTITDSGNVMDFNGTSVSFTNNLSGTFIFSNGATTTTTGNFTNNGTYNIPASHIMVIDGDTNQSMGGIIGGTVIINKGSGGNLTLATSTSINLGSNAITTVNPTYTGLSGIITNNGTITVNSGSLTFKNAGVNSNVNFVNNGSVIHNGNSWNIGNTAYVNYINNTGATTTYAGTAITANGSFTQNGVFDMSGKTITFNNYAMSRTLTANGALGGSVIIASSNLIVTAGTSITLATTSMGGYLTNNGTVTFPSGSNTWTMGSVVNNGTINHNGTGWVLSGLLANNASGTITYASTTITIAGNFTQLGTFDLVGKTVTFSGTGDQTINAGVSLASSTVIITKIDGGNLTISTSTLINLGSNATTTTNPTWTGASGIITNNGTITVNSGSLTFKNAGTNSNVNFVNNGSIIHNGNSWNIGNTNYVNYINNTGATTIYAGTTITANGSFTQNGTFDMTGKTITFNSGLSDRVLTVNGALGGATIISGPLTIASGTSITLATTSMGGSLTNNGTIIFPSGSNTWTIGSVVNNGTINHNGGGWTLNGSLVNNASGTITYASTTITANGSFTQLGTFNLVGKTVTFSGTGDQTINAGVSLASSTSIINKAVSGNLTIAAGTYINLGDSPNTAFDPTYTGTSGIFTNNGTILVNSGIWTITNAYQNHNAPASLINNGTIIHNGTGWVFATLFTGSYYSFTNNAGATTTYVGTSISLNGNFTQNGYFNLSGKTITFNGCVNATLTATTSIPFGSIILNKCSSYTLTLASNLTVENASTTSGTLNNPATAKTLTVTGNLYVANASLFGGANLTVNMSGGIDQNLLINSGSFLTPITINKSGTGRVVLATTTTTGSGAAATITVNSGSLYLNGKTLSATTTVNSGGELQIQGNEFFTTPTLNTGSIVTYVGDGNATTTSYFLNSSIPYQNLKVNLTDSNIDIVSSSGPAATSTGLISYWNADNNAQNSIGTNHGTLNGGMGYINGKYDKAFKFDGSDDYILTASSTLANGLTAFSMSAWIYISAFTNDYPGIVYMSGVGNHVYGFAGRTAVSKQINFYANNNTTYTAASSAALNAGQWYHIAGTWTSGDYVKLYVNTTKTTSAATLSGTMSSDDFIKMGWDDCCGATRKFNGLIDDVRIYNRALSDSEVAALYAGGTSTLILPGSLTVSSGILAATSTNLIMSGASSTISLNATTTFASLTAGSTTASTTLRFGNTGNLVITGTTTLQGTSTMPLTLGAITEGEQWHFTPDGARVLGYLDVQDSYNHSTDINAMSYTSITNSGHNTGWTFSNPTLTIGRSGTQLSTTTATSTDVNLGGAFTLTPSGGDFTLSALKLHQAGSFPIEDISDIRIYSEATTTCSATKPATLDTYATTTTFDANKVATTTFYTPVTLPTGTTTCLYITYDLSGVAGTSTMGRTIDLEISNPSLDVTAITGSITPTRSINISGTTMIPADNEVIVPAFPTLATTTNPNCSSNVITSLLSLTMPREAKNPTLYYLQNCAVYKQVGTTTARRLTTPGIQVHDLSFEKMSGGNVRISITASNMDPGQENTFMNVTRTLSTSATVRVWRGN